MIWNSHNQTQFVNKQTTFRVKWRRRLLSRVLPLSRRCSKRCFLLGTQVVISVKILGRVKDDCRRSHMKKISDHGASKPTGRNNSLD